MDLWVEEEFNSGSRLVVSGPGRGRGGVGGGGPAGRSMQPCYRQPTEA